MTTKYPKHKLACALAEEGDKTVPPESAIQAGTGRFSQRQGWGQYNSLPLGEGGIPPKRDDFNGAFYLLSQFLLWYQQGGIMKYDATLDYEPDNEVFASGVKYRCIKANGISTKPVAPTAAEGATYWKTQDTGDVRWDVAQKLSTSQQAQARKNIDVPSVQEVTNQLLDAIKGFVAFDKAQSLSPEQKKQARDNIGAVEGADITEFVSYERSQALNAKQQKQARDNIACPSAQDVEDKLDTAISSVNSAFCRAARAGETVRTTTGGNNFSVVVSCTVKLGIDNGKHTRNYDVKINGSVVGTISLYYHSERYGGKGFGRVISMNDTKHFFASRKINKNDSIVVEATTEGIHVYSEVVTIMVC